MTPMSDGCRDRLVRKPEQVAHSISHFLKQLSIVGRAPKAQDGRVDRDSVASTMHAWDDRRPASRPRVWSACCHRVELPPQFPQLRCGDRKLCRREPGIVL